MFFYFFFSAATCAQQTGNHIIVHYHRFLLSCHLTLYLQISLEGLATAFLVAKTHCKLYIMHHIKESVAANDLSTVFLLKGGYVYSKR